MAASSRPLQPLNISTARCLLRGDWETDDPASIIYYVTLARRAKLSLFLSLSLCRSRLDPSFSIPSHHYPTAASLHIIHTTKFELYIQ